jgi:hypothetical protein
MDTTRIPMEFDYVLLVFTKTVHDFLHEVLKAQDPDYWEQLVIKEYTSHHSNKKEDRSNRSSGGNEERTKYRVHLHTTDTVLSDLDLDKLMKLIDIRDLFNIICNKLQLERDTLEYQELVNTVKYLKVLRQNWSHIRARTSIDTLKTLKIKAIDSMITFIILIGQSDGRVRDILEQYKLTLSAIVDVSTQPTTETKDEEEEAPMLKDISACLEQTGEWRKWAKNNFTFEVLPCRITIELTKLLDSASFSSAFATSSQHVLRVWGRQDTVSNLKKRLPCKVEIANPIRPSKKYRDQGDSLWLHEEFSEIKIVD